MKICISIFLVRNATRSGIHGTTTVEAAKCDKSDNIIRMITITHDFYLVTSSKWDIWMWLD